MTNAETARRTLEEWQRSVHAQLGLPVPEPPSEAPSLSRYLETNPDYSPEQREAQEQAYVSHHFTHRSDLALCGGSLSILADRVDELKAACLRVNPEWDLRKICFGTIPGGGLDAYVQAVDGTDEYAVVVPEGFFYLSNLVAKMVVLLQPLEPTPSGAVVYPRDAALRQIALLEHPYVLFRERDLLNAYFVYGEPRCALPYKSALPYQDRFSYLLVGVEIYLLAHEVSHVLLGHIGRGAGDALSAEDELTADGLALQILTAYFAEGDHAPARAGLSGLFFHALNALWESTIVAALGDRVVSEAITRHPPARRRLEQFVGELLVQPTDDTPGWYQFELSALDYALARLPARLADDMLEAAGEFGGLSSRVMPTSLAHLGHFAIWSHDDAWWRAIAMLITAENPSERLLGRWFLLQNEPWAAIGFYEGLVGDDEAWARLCRAALVSVVPEYEHYLPRLLERFRETDQEDELASYLVTIAGYVSLSAMRDLGNARLHADPMQPGFFDTQS